MGPPQQAGDQPQRAYQRSLQRWARDAHQQHTRQARRAFKGHRWAGQDAVPSRAERVFAHWPCQGRLLPTQALFTVDCPFMVEPLKCNGSKCRQCSSALAWQSSMTGPAFCALTTRTQRLRSRSTSTTFRTSWPGWGGSPARYQFAKPPSVSHAPFIKQEPSPEFG